MSGEAYRVNEVFYSVQGEGMRAGEASVFVRFSNCNLRCEVEPGERSPGGFDCDTEFESGRRVSLDELVAWIYQEVKPHVTDDDRQGLYVVLTGGEPGLQVDEALCDELHIEQFKVAIETNGSIRLPIRQRGSEHGRKITQIMEAGDPSELGLDGLLYRMPFDWITVSPKVAEHAIKQLWAHEVKYVRGWGQELPNTPVRARYRLVSPAFDGLRVEPRTMRWCQELVMKNPGWRLSVQGHKMSGGIR